MKKIAIFVEGQTEQIFVEKLIIEIAGRNDVVIRDEKAAKNSNGKRIFTIIKSESKDPKKSFYILIRDCSSDTTVKSDIIENSQNLARGGYSKIIGLRDVYPNTDVKRLRALVNYGLPTKYVPIKIHLSVMEVEAWFIAEINHFQKISPLLTLHKIKRKTGYDLNKTNIEKIEHPAYTLDQIYRIAHCSYNKSRQNVQRTVDAIDYAKLYLNVRSRVKSLNNFISDLDSFLSKK